VGDDSHLVFRQKLLGDGRSLRWGIVMVKQPGLFSPKFGATSSHVFMQSPQNVAVMAASTMGRRLLTILGKGKPLRRADGDRHYI
jgi:hypothetical protein